MALICKTHAPEHLLRAMLRSLRSFRTSNLRIAQDLVGNSALLERANSLQCTMTRYCGIAFCCDISIAMLCWVPSMRAHGYV